MSAPVTKRTTDHSGLESFSFSFFCDICGKDWKSPPQPFQSGGFTVIDREDARRLIWEQEHRAAFEKANVEAHLHFNKCPVCGKRVCDDCFGMGDELCRECSGSNE